MRRLLCFVAAFYALSLAAQTSWEGEHMPWLPFRAPQGVRCIREYEPSTVIMGKRTLITTTCFDRQGYEVSPLITLTYDTLGRLTRRVKVVQREIAGTILSDPEEVDQIYYSPNGLVSHYTKTEYIYYGPMSTDTHSYTYRLISATHQTGIGVSRCMYQVAMHWGYRYREMEDKLDTFFCDLVMDTLGRVVARGMYGQIEDDPFVQRQEYTYLPDGRVESAVVVANEETKRLVYQYNHLGTLIGMNGRYEDVQGGMGDIIIRCQPNGIPIEETIKWYADDDEADYYDLPEGKTLTRIVYDRHGNISRREVPGYPVLEYDYEYWE